MSMTNEDLFRDLLPFVSDKLAKKFSESTGIGVVSKLDIRSVTLGTSLMLKPNKTEERRLKDMEGFFHDKEAFNKADKEKSVYRICYFNFDGLSCAITVMSSGKIGNEYFLTKGHFHRPLEMSEIYIFLSGQGVSILQRKDKEKPVLIAPLTRGTVAYAPPFYAHRTVNIGNDDLCWISIFDTKARLDYEPILKEGFKVLVVEEDGKATYVANKSHI